jgi:UDP-N-acetyl-2-amino-2-deoxyglucuronate dehydrogenase
MARTRIALIGCGRILKKHLDALAEQAGIAELVAVCDLDPAKAEAAGAQTGVRHFTDFREMLGAVDCDLVGVLTDSGSHSGVAVAVMEEFGKPVLVEKPMALSLEDADAMLAASERTGARLFVVKQNRFNPGIVAARKARDAGRFGRMVMGTVRLRWRRDEGYYGQADWRGTWAEDGGCLTNQTIHYIDLMTWLMGEIDTVYAQIATRLVDIEAEDTAAVVIRFKDGALGVVESTTATRPNNLEGSVSILGEGGSVVLGGFATNQVDTWAFADVPDEQAEADASYPIDNVYGFGHVALYGDVIEALNSGRRALIEGAEGRKVLELLHAIYESAETGREVKLGAGSYPNSKLGRRGGL